MLLSVVLLCEEPKIDSGVAAPSPQNKLEVASDLGTVASNPLLFSHHGGDKGVEVGFTAALLDPGAVQGRFVSADVHGAPVCLMLLGGTSDQVGATFLEAVARDCLLVRWLGLSQATAAPLATGSPAGAGGDCAGLTKDWTFTCTT